MAVRESASTLQLLATSGQGRREVGQSREMLSPPRPVSQAEEFRDCFHSTTSIKAEELDPHKKKEPDYFDRRRLNILSQNT